MGAPNAYEGGFSCIRVPIKLHRTLGRMGASGLAMFPEVATIFALFLDEPGREKVAQRVEGPRGCHEHHRYPGKGFDE